MTSEIERVSAFAATLIGNACERHSAEIAVMGFHEFQQVQPKSCHWCCEADRDRLAAEVDRLLQALRNIRLAAARGRTFGHQATLQPHVRMAARKDEALEQVLQFCAQLGVDGSLLRKANAALAEAPTPVREEGQ